MKIVSDIVRRFSVRLMLVAIVTLALQAGGAWAYGLGDTGDCPNEVHPSRTTDRASDVPAFGRPDIGRGPEAPCTSACCNVACSMAVLAVPATFQTPASTPGIRYVSAFRGAEGIDWEGLSRPPRTSPTV